MYVSVRYKIKGSKGWLVSEQLGGYFQADVSPHLILNALDVGDMHFV